MNLNWQESLRNKQKEILTMLRFGYFLNTTICCLIANTVFADSPLIQNLHSYQNELIYLAFQSATKIPVNPHIKDRSKSQELVVQTCLKLNQPELALEYIDSIKNWRRGSCYADLALYYAQNGESEKINLYLNLAEKIADETEDWRRDHIRVKIAQIHALLGDEKKASEYESGVVESEVGKVDAVEASQSDEESFQQTLQSLDALAKQQSFDVLKNTLNAYAKLYGRFYSSEEKRSLIEEKIKTSWTKIPVNIRIDVLIQLAEVSIRHSAKQKALQFADEAQSFLVQYQWKIEHKIPLTARVVELRFKAGDQKTAELLAKESLNLFIKNKQQIVNIWRAGALRPLAQAFKTIGDEKSSLSVYKLAIDEGSVNPNSRPRAEDLTATCCSMAFNSIEPDEELWARINQIFKELDQPW